MGPHSLIGSGGLPTGDVLGGDALSAIAAVVSAPLPIRAAAEAGVRVQAALSVGALTPGAPTLGGLLGGPAGGGGLLSAVRRGADEHLRASASVGVSIPMNPSVNIDVSLSRPLRTRQHDQVECFQLSVGMGFR